MPGLTLTFFGLVAAATHAAAAIAFSGYLCGGNDDNPVHDSNYTSSSHNRRTTRVQTQPSYRPPPQRPSHTYRPDLGRGAYHPSAVSPCTRTPSQTQPSSTRTQPPSIAHSASTSSRVPATVPTERDPLLHPVIRSVSRSNAYSPYARTPVQTQLSSTRTQPSSTRTQPSSSNIQSSSTRTQAFKPHPSLINTVHVPELPESEFSQTRSQAHVPARVHTRNEPPPPTVNQVISSDLRSEQPAGVEDLDFADKLRTRARHRWDEMSEERTRAKSAQKRGHKEAAQAHTQKAIAHEKAVKDLNKRAAKIIFTEKNKDRKDGRIDLHLLHVVEAIQFAKDQVQIARSRGEGVVQFIVGQGLHAKDGVAKIRPALEGHFTKQGLKHSLDPKNPGVLIVRLDCQ